MYIIQPGSSDYPTGGYALSALNARLKYIHGAQVVACNAAAAVYVAQPIFAAGFFSTTLPAPQTSIKLMVLQSAGFTPAGTNSAPTISVGSGTPATYAVGLSTNSNAAALIATGAATGITGVQAPTFTGTAVAAAGLVELTASTDLSTCAWAVRLWGY